MYLQKSPSPIYICFFWPVCAWQLWVTGIWYKTCCCLCCCSNTKSNLQCSSMWLSSKLTWINVIDQVEKLYYNVHWQSCTLSPHMFFAGLCHRNFCSPETGTEAPEGILICECVRTIDSFKKQFSTTVPIFWWVGFSVPLTTPMGFQPPVCFLSRVRSIWSTHNLFYRKSHKPNPCCCYLRGLASDPRIIGQIVWNILIQ